MADIQYLNYGDLQIEQLALLNNLSDNVYKYVQSQPWSSKKKEKFMSAYQDIMSRGLTGASNSTGEWKIGVGGAPLLSMDRKDREMYEEAAYFIQLQMSKLPTRTSSEKEKETEKSELPIFDNNAFVTDFRKHISNTEKGGREFVIDDEWNNLDTKRNEKGERERTERTKKLLGYLNSYKLKFDSSKFNFEESPFGTKEEFRKRLDAAIAALKSPDLTDDNDSLNRLGLNPKDWFNNGTGDVYTGDKDFNKLYEGKGTYGLYYNEYLPTLLELRNKQLLLIELERKLNQYTRYQFYGAKPGEAARIGTPVRELYRGKELDYLKSLATKTDLTHLEVDELIGGFRLFEQQGKLSKLSKEELDKFGPSMKSRANNFRKIEGLEGFYWDPVAQRIVRPINENAAPLTIDSLTIFDLNSPEALQLKYLNNTEFTDADWAELGGIAADIASIVDPEPWTAGGLGIAAAASRNYARTRGSEKWGFSDYASQGLDYLTGLAGAIPLFGDAALVSKTVKNLVPWLRKAMRVPAFLDLWNSTPEMVPIGKKLMNGEDLTVLDWMNLGTFVRGLATTRNLNVTNRASRKALQERGYLVSNRLDKRMGLTSSKPIGESTSSTVRMTINGKTEEIPISAETKLKLDLELAKKGNDIEARSKVVRDNADVQAAAEKAGIKVKEKVTDADGKVTEKISDNWNNSKIVYDNSISTSLRNARLIGNRIGLTPSFARTSGGMYGSIIKPIERSSDNFENYLNSSRTLWDKFKYGSNRTLRRMDPGKATMPQNSNLAALSFNLTVLSSELLPNPPRTREVFDNFKASGKAPTPPKHNMTRSEWKKENKKLYRDVNKGHFTDNMPEEGVYEFKDQVGNTHTFRLILRDDDFLLDVKSSNGVNRLSVLSLDLIKLGVWENIKESLNTGTGLRSDISLPANIIRVLLGTAYGWLKQGGRIDKLKIEMYKKYIGG